MLHVTAVVAVAVAVRAVSDAARRL